GVKRNPVPEPPRELLSWGYGYGYGSRRWPKGKDLGPVYLPSKTLCVFLGKSSTLAQADVRASDAPFGREVLQTILRNPNALLRRRLSITREAGAVNIRSRCPDVQDGKAYYGSIVSLLDSAWSIKLRNVLPLRYHDDNFFWGVI